MWFPSIYESRTVSEGLAKVIYLLLTCCELPIAQSAVARHLLVLDFAAPSCRSQHEPATNKYFGQHKMHLPEMKAWNAVDLTFGLLDERGASNWWSDGCVPKSNIICHQLKQCGFIIFKTAPPPLALHFLRVFQTLCPPSPAPSLEGRRSRSQILINLFKWIMKQ